MRHGNGAFSATLLHGDGARWVLGLGATGKGFQTGAKRLVGGLKRLLRFIGDVLVTGDCANKLGETAFDRRGGICRSWLLLCHEKHPLLEVTQTNGCVI
jgi:hypothetical protein